MATETSVLAGFVEFGETVSDGNGGFCGSYDLTTFAAAQTTLASSATFGCPLLLAVEGLDKQPGFSTQTFLGGKPKQIYTFDHYLLGARSGDVAAYEVYRATLIGLRDNYIAALQANPFMTFNGAVSYHTTPEVTVQIMDTEWFDNLFHGVLFRYSVGIYL